MPETVDLSKTTSPDIKKEIKSERDTVVFAVGSTEQHGPCLPIATDTLLGDALALSVAESLPNAFKGPTLNIGCSEHHMHFPGTISLRKETLHSVIRDYVSSLVRHGFKRIIILPSHGGNFQPLAEITSELQRTHEGVKIISYSDLQRFVSILHGTSKKLGITPEESGAHAGECETSMMMWMREDLVKEEKIPSAIGYMGEFNEDVTIRIFKDGINALSPIGVLGDPTKAKKEHGKLYMDDLVSAIVKYIKSQ